VPLVSCPKCATNLKIPDGASGNVKCPKCATIFPAAAKPAPAPPAFEVVDDTPAPAPKRPAKPEVLDPDFDVVDVPKPKKKAVAAEDDDDGRPRSKRRRDEEDDNDDRSRRKKGRRRDDEDDDWRPAGKGVSFGPAKVGMLMLSISLWLYLGTFVLLGLFLLVAWIGASIPEGLMIVTGLLGLSNWIVALIGLGFCIAGPPKSRGLAIAATAVAAIHLIMAFVVANNEKSGRFGSHTVELLSGINKADRFFDIMKKMEKETDARRREDLQKELRDLSESERGRKAPFSLEEGRPTARSAEDMRWRDLATLQLYSDQFIAILSYQSKEFSDYILGFLTGLLEVARLILIVLLIGAVARAARDHDGAEKSMLATFLAGGATILAMVIVVIVAAIMDNMKPDTPKSVDDAMKAAKRMMTWPILGELAVYAVHIGSLVLPALLAISVKSAAARRAR
jgi:LSD1 subclass zinc finger protein